MDPAVFSESISTVNTQILNNPYPVFMGQHEKWVNNLGIWAWVWSVGQLGAKVSWDLAAAEDRPWIKSRFHSSNP